MTSRRDVAGMMLGVWEIPSAARTSASLKESLTVGTVGVRLCCLIVVNVGYPLVN